jgi:hypothetical protein
MAGLKRLQGCGRVLVALIRSFHGAIPDSEQLYKCVNAVDIARSKILSEIDVLLLRPPSEIDTKRRPAVGCSRAIRLSQFFRN